MTWKRELAFWAFMFVVVGPLFIVGVVSVGNFIANNWGAYVNVREVAR